MSSNGLYRLASQQQNSSTSANWLVSSSICLLARDTYWERIVYYPTGNLFEVSKIISAEIQQASPTDGKTFAYIVSVSKRQTVVLYCCFSEQILIKAGSMNLWRLIPESLPLYRALFDQNGIYSATLSLYPFDRAETAAIENQVSSSQIILKIGESNLSSLPAESEELSVFSEVLLADASLIQAQESYALITKYQLLDAVDFIVQSTFTLKKLLHNKGNLAATVGKFMISLLLTFTLGKSAILVWQESTLKAEVAQDRAKATHSIGLSNQLKKVNTEIGLINTKLNEHGSKAQLLKLLHQVIDKDNQLEFSTINISPVDIVLLGTVKSAAELMATLSRIAGFNQVQFSSPPVTIKNVGERFNINISYNLQAYNVSNSELEL